MSWKAFVNPLFEPLGMIWLWMLSGTIVFLWRRQWKYAVWLAGPVTLLFLFGGTSLTERLIATAERPFAASASWPPVHQISSNSDVVLVLGGGYYVSKHDPFGFALSHAGSRLLTALELTRLLKPKTLVVGGGAVLIGGSESGTSSLVQDWAGAWCPSGVVVTNLGVCADTRAEAVQFRKLQELHGWKKVVLVTSALHMRRSEAVFKHEGVSVEPHACDFQSLDTAERFQGYSPFPRQERLLMLSYYLHEKVGWLFYQWRGWV